MYEKVNLTVFQEVGTKFKGAEITMGDIFGACRISFVRTNERGHQKNQHLDAE